MALKQKITKEVFDKLSKDVQSEYKSTPGNDDEYTLDLEGYEDPGELRRARDREKADAAQAKKDKIKAEEELAELRRTTSRGTGDIAALEKSWKETADNRVNEAKGETKKTKAKLAKIMRDDVALRIATKISVSPDLILPHIANRLQAEIPDDGDPLTRVLDKDGKPSASTVEDLEKEFVADPKFAAIIIGSKASGGGASGDHNSGGAGKKPSEYTAADRVTLFKSDPKKHNELFPPQL